MRRLKLNTTAKHVKLPVEYSMVQSVVKIFEISCCGNSMSSFTTSGSVIFQMNTKSCTVCDTIKIKWHSSFNQHTYHYWICKMQWKCVYRSLIANLMRKWMHRRPYHIMIKSAETACATQCASKIAVAINLQLSIIMEHTCVSCGYDSNFIAQDSTSVNLFDE